LVIWLCLNQVLFAQEPAVSFFNYEKYTWNASWISHPTVITDEYGVYHYRNSFTLDSVPADFIIKVSADNRYKLFLNGRFVCLGPSRGNLQYWRYEQVDIAPYLKKGDNTLAALVWSMGECKPLAQFSCKTAFLLSCDTYSDLNTGKGNWKVYKSNSYMPLTNNRIRGYYACGATDQFNGQTHPWGWKLPGFDDTNWVKPVITDRAIERGYLYAASRMLVPRTIPLMEHKRIEIETIRQSEGIKLDNKKLDFTEPLVIPGKTNVTLLLDQGHLTMGYPEINVSRGTGCRFTLTYAEALYSGEKYEKGDRNEIEDKTMTGYQDIFYADGGDNRILTPLWNRTWRYIELKIQTSQEAVVINDLYAMFSAYPFEKVGVFESDDERLSTIFTIGWRTARLCAQETYFDCPYYEQLQYIGDTRIQCLISLYMTGDDRLMKKAIQEFDRSRIPDGLTQSRYPSSILQIIPPFSLYWVKMIHDYYIYASDHDFVRQHIDGIIPVLTWFERRIDENGLPKIDEWWNFVDWSPYYYRGMPHGVNNGHSSIMALQLVDAFQSASFLFGSFGRDYEASRYKHLADMISLAVYSHCYDSSRKLIAQTPDKKVFSQHANVMGILTNCIPEEKQPDVMKTILSDSTLIQCSIYYKFYLFRALNKTGMMNEYLSCIDEWHKMVGLGLTTFAEGLHKTRSDCHAWSASPCFDMLYTVAGIKPLSPGFKTVEIAPAFSYLKRIEAVSAHPKGVISVNVKRKGKFGVAGKIVLPEGVAGQFKWKDKILPLHSGSQNIFVK
jgi:hypothetical protein